MIFSQYFYNYQEMSHRHTSTNDERYDPDIMYSVFSNISDGTERINFKTLKELFESCFNDNNELMVRDDKLKQQIRAGLNKEFLYQYHKITIMQIDVNSFIPNEE